MPAKYTGTLITSLNSNNSPSWGVISSYLQEQDLRWIFFINLDYHLCPVDRWGRKWEEISPLKYFTAASPLLLAAVVMWNVRPPLFLQRNLIRVKCKCFLSSFMALFVSTISLLLTPRYDVLTGNWVGDELCDTTLDTRSHPPKIR